MLADAGADVPDASVAPLERRGARELEEPETATFAGDLEELEDPFLGGEQDEPGAMQYDVTLEDLEAPPLNALAEPGSRPMLERDAEALVPDDERADVDESAAAHLFEPALEDGLGFGEAEDLAVELASAGADEPEALFEGVDLADEAEPEVELEGWEPEWVGT